MVTSCHKYHTVHNLATTDRQINLFAANIPFFAFPDVDCLDAQSLKDPSTDLFPTGAGLRSAVPVSRTTV